MNRSQCKFVLSICPLLFLVGCAKHTSSEFGPTAPIFKPGMTDQEMVLRLMTNIVGQMGSHEDTAHSIVAQLDRISTPDEVRRWGLSQINPYRERSATEDDGGVGIPLQNWPAFVTKLMDSQPTAVSVRFKSPAEPANVSICLGRWPDRSLRGFDRCRRLRAGNTRGS